VQKKKIIILGAAGRDFHNFNTYYRNDPRVEVVAFTAAQIPDIEGRRYPTELAGPFYPEGIPIIAEDELEKVIPEWEVEECVFSYSDVSYRHVMHLSAIVNTAGANFNLLGTRASMLESIKPVIAVCATRTGAGKSQTARKIVEILMEKGLKVVAIRHPMPYGNLVEQKVQRFAEIGDLKKHNCTIEEMEEYEPHIVRGNVIYSGVDYEAILRAAEKDSKGCDVIVWDGGNNDFSFIRPDLQVTVLDPHRAGHELSYYPSEVNLKLADVCIINKVDTANVKGVNKVRRNIRSINSDTLIIEAASPIQVQNRELIRNKRVLVVEDGPTLTHGGMKIGAGMVAARKHGAREMVDPRPYLVGKLKRTFETYPDIGTLLPAMGYGEEQLKDLEATINNTDCDSVIIGTPIDLGRILNINKPYTRVFYDLHEIGKPDLDEVLDDFLKKFHLGRNIRNLMAFS
jgi:predicted GTPase